MSSEKPTPESIVGYRTVRELCFEARVLTWQVHRDLKAGRLKADRPGREFLFTPQQFQAALRYYRKREAIG